MDYKREVISKLYKNLTYLQGIHQAGRTGKYRHKVTSSYRIVYPLLPLGLWEFGDVFGCDLFVYLKNIIDTQVKLNKLYLCNCPECTAAYFADILHASDQAAFYSFCYKHIQHNEA
jgi:hypothetical protein